MNKLPVIALRSMTVLPDMVIHFDISRKKSIRAVEKAMEMNQRLIVATQTDPEVDEPTFEDVYNTCTVVKIKQIIKLPDSIIRVLVEGDKKAVLSELAVEEGMLVGEYDEAAINDEVIGKDVNKAYLIGLKELIRQYASANKRMSRDVLKKWMGMNDAKKLLWAFAVDYPMDYRERIYFLEMDSLEEMYENAARILIEDINASRIKEEIELKVKERVDKHQREYILREQLKVLNEELNPEDTITDAQEYLKLIDELEAGDDIKEKLRKAVKRYKMLGQGSAEANVERSYIELALELPWDKMSQDNTNLDEAERILNEDHYGMDKIKERIIAALAVRNITKKGDAPIICLVGPPGTGKTSIAKSVARALNKEYVRICLGGVKDEAEIRGHRKTYIGAMPGRIINGLKEAKVKNPLMLLDEIDKISSNHKGDTASALLEVLDSEQNSHFVDHYVELPTDLSEVLFIATANDVSAMSRPLLDRMEIIEVSSYTKNEKCHIAKEHLIPKQLEKNGLTKKQLKIGARALDLIIEGYTREAGVRSLERCIGRICRKAVRQLYHGDGTLREDVAVVKVSDKNIYDYLGKRKYRPDVVNKKDAAGVVRGLAWTSVGGDTLEIEVNTMSGKGELILTGQMGDVMKESARIALSLTRAILSDKKYKVDRDYFEKNSIHLHIPEGAVPKDGPSAGITMVTALVSAVTDTPVRADVAMTGEVTLRGKVLAIGGLKEKLLAANKAGVKKVIVPVDNTNDVDELDEEILGNMEVVYASDISEVLKEALV